MAYQALYRKWRPQTFEQVLGQTATVKTLRRQIEAGRIAHAYLFCGCRGTGKTTMAKLMSRAINCQAPNEGDPCGKCEACRAIMNETTMDVLEMDAASNSRVEDMRELLEQVRYPAQIGKYKVYIIDEVHMLSNSAFNALLKTLEEPPAHVVFILATTEPQKLPATILSRVQRYDFGRIPSSLMVERMREALNDLGMAAEDEALRMVARAAEGAMRDAFSILDMCVAGAESGMITAAQTRDMLGTSDREFLFAFFQLLAERDECGVMLKVDELMRSGREPQVFMRELSSHSRALLTVKAVKQDAASILDITEEDEVRYRGQAELFSDARLLKILDLFMKAEGELRFASTPRIGLESAALHACEQSSGEDASALLERIGELESKLARMEAEIASGSVVVSTSRKTEATPSAASKTQESAPAKPELPPVPSDAKGVWERVIDSIKKKEPSLLAFVKTARFIGCKGNVYQVVIPMTDRAKYDGLMQPKRRERIGALLTEITGQQTLFEAIMESDVGGKKVDAVRENAQQSLIDTFGRENVQIDEGKQQ